MLRAGVGGLLAVPLAALAGCTSDPAHEAPDPLAPLAAQARQDAADANAIAKAVPGLAEPATVIAKGRMEHALALQAEVDRVNPPATSTPPPAPASPAVPKSASAAKKKLRDALTKGQQQSAALVASATRNRAGLLGSVSAGCACLREEVA